MSVLLQQRDMKTTTALAALVAVCCGGGCRNRSDSVGNSDAEQTAALVQTSPTAGYVPDEACRDCHQELYDSYQDVGMANSYYPASKARAIEDFENSHYYHPASDRHYEMEAKNGELFQVRYQTDSGGNRKNELRVKVDAVIGSGNHVRSYVYRTPSGEMFQMPLAWYSKAKKWRMNPGYDNANHLGFQRKITRDCMFCHNAYPAEVPAGTDEHWQPPTFPDRLPHGIGCQRCHGPGADHIKMAESSSSTADSIASTIVNPADLTPELQGDVCMQCHLQPSSQILSEQVREDRTNYSYRPGEPLASYRAMLDYGTDAERLQGKSSGEERFEINHHAYRLRQSSCFLESSGEMQCTSCHDPHRKVSTASRLEHYRSACVKCHAVSDCEPAVEIETHASETSTAQLADCAGCHMPIKRSHDVIHATMTDHKIVAIATPEQSRLAPLAEPSALPRSTKIDAYFGESRSEDDTSIYRLIASIELGDASALRRLAAIADAQEKPSVLVLSELATGYQKNGDLQSELNVLSRAVQLYPDHVRTNQEMGAALAAAQMHEQALPYYQRALAIGPALPETHVGLGMSMLHRNEVESAVKHFREAVRLRPLYPEALLNLGIALFAIQEFDEAADFLLRAQAADPMFTEAETYLNQIPPSAR
ncbi:MAG: hypothetical protein Aurels2KO_31020 [Aureliella sp.]